MATVTSKVCDVNADHGEAETVNYGLAGEYFEGDFCADDVAKLTKALEPFIAVGTPVSMKDLAKSSNGVGDFDPVVVRALGSAQGQAGQGPRPGSGRARRRMASRYQQLTG